MWAEIRGYWIQLNLDYFTIPSLRPVSCFMATHQLDVGTSTSSDWSRFTYSRLKLNLLPPVIWSNNWSNRGAVIQSHNSAKWSWSVDFSASLVQGLATQVKFRDKPAQQVIDSLVIGLPMYFQTWVPSRRPIYMYVYRLNICITFTNSRWGRLSKTVKTYAN